MICDQDSALANIAADRQTRPALTSLFRPALELRSPLYDRIQVFDEGFHLRLSNQVLCVPVRGPAFAFYFLFSFQARISRLHRVAGNHYPLAAAFSGLARKFSFLLSHDLRNMR